MPSTSGSDSFPMLVALSSLFDHPKPLLEWTNPVTGTCRCGGEVWMHDSIRAVLQQPKYLGLCPPCYVRERERQAAP
jgi:hypothetical protein